MVKYYNAPVLIPSSAWFTLLLQDSEPESDNGSSPTNLTKWDSPNAQVNKLFAEADPANPGPHNDHIEVLPLLTTHRFPLHIVMMNLESDGDPHVFEP